MKTLSLTDWPVRIDGVVSLEQTQRGLVCWRIPHEQRDLFNSAMHFAASGASGVRLGFESDTSVLEIDITMAGDMQTGPRWDGNFDLLVDGELHQRRNFAKTEPVEFDEQTVKTLRFDDLPDGQHLLRLYLPQLPSVGIVALRIDEHASVAPDRRCRARWLAHGSSITHCGHAGGPSETWPALVARQFDYDLTNLGYGGQCHLDQMVARIIRDRPADLISLCFGINVQGAGSLGPRAFRESAIGFIKTIRDAKPDTPMALMSPIFSFDRESEPNTVGLNLPMMRDMLRETVEVLTRHGDENLIYINGLQIIGEADGHLLSDRLHPDPEGYKLMAKRYADLAMPRLQAMIKED